MFELSNTGLIPAASRGVIADALANNGEAADDQGEVKEPPACMPRQDNSDLSELLPTDGLLVVNSEAQSGVTLGEGGYDDTHDPNAPFFFVERAEESRTTRRRRKGRERSAWGRARKA